MPLFKFQNIKISGISSAVPKKIVRTTDYSEKFGSEQVEKFISMTGIEEHRETSRYQTASDLGYVAAVDLLSKKNINRDEIGLLIFGAHSTDYKRPATACVLHKRLGLGKNCAAFDVSLGCSAFIYCAQIAMSMMQSSDIKKTVVIVGETLSKMVNSEDAATVMLFGDAASAILFEKDTEADSITGILKTDGNGYRAIIAPAGSFRNPDAPTTLFDWPDGNKRTLYNTIMNGTDVFSFTITDVPKTLKEHLKENQKTVDDYDCFAMHQANYFIHKQLTKKLKVPVDKMPISLDKYGNTSAPAIPLTLCKAYGETVEEHNLRTLMCGFGVGLSWGTLEADINTKDIFPVIETDEIFTEGIMNSPEDVYGA